MITLATNEVVELLLSSAARGGLSPAAWQEQRAKAMKTADVCELPRNWPTPSPDSHWDSVRPSRYSGRCYWPRDWPEFSPERYWSRMIPVNYLDQRAGWGKAIAQFVCFSNEQWAHVEGLWDIFVLPDEQPGAVVVVSGFLSPHRSLRPAPSDHKMLWLRQQGLSRPGRWDMEVFDASNPWPASRLERLAAWRPSSVTDIWAA